MIVKIKKPDDLPMPEYATLGSSGVDLYSNEYIMLHPHSRALVSTGISLEIPKGYEIQIRSRSGLAYKEGIFCLNSPGTIDSDYRGEIKVILYNTDDKEFNIKKGDKIAQAVLTQYEKIDFVEVLTISSDTDRGEKGFGSSGISLL